VVRAKSLTGVFPIVLGISHRKLGLGGKVNTARRPRHAVDSIALLGGY
jgi:hypothetical protein